LCIVGIKVDIEFYRKKRGRPKKDSTAEPKGQISIHPKYGKIVSVKDEETGIFYK
jgi:hypothetical protein